MQRLLHAVRVLRRRRADGIHGRAMARPCRRAARRCPDRDRGEHHPGRAAGRAHGMARCGNTRDLGSRRVRNADLRACPAGDLLARFDQDATSRVMISSRFVRPVALAIALATVPTIRHTYLRQVVPDGRTTAPVQQALSHLASTPGDRTASWMQRVLETEDWYDRTYRVGSKQIRLFVGRSYDAKRLY